MPQPHTLSSKLDYEPQSLAGQRVVISGGSLGIGRATAVMLAAEGARVLIFARHEKELDDALKDIREVGEGHALAADQAEEEDVKRVFAEARDKLGGLDILVNNAAVAAKGIAEMSYEEWRYVVDANLLGYMRCSELALQLMEKQGKGHIVNVGSMSADEREAGSDVYVATKAAIQAFSEAFRKHANEKGIKVSLIEPGRVGTSLSSREPGIEKKQQEKQAAGEMLKAEDIAACIRYCLVQPPRCDVVRVQIRPHKQLI